MKPACGSKVMLWSPLGPFLSAQISRKIFFELFLHQKLDVLF